MSEMERRVAFVKKAESFLGCNEADGTHRPIIDLYNAHIPSTYYRMTYSDPWCAAFVSAVAAACGLKSIIPMECSCDRMIALAKQKGIWHEDENFTPQIGDIPMYDWSDSGIGNNTGSADHVGIVAAVSGKTIVVIEGNISDKVGYRNITVNGKNLRGYITPNFNLADKPETKPEEVIVQATETVPVSLPVLSKGAVSASVRAAQILLIGNGCSCGPDGPDGDFGNNTAGAVVLFQNKKGLHADGVIGKDTWTALLR